MDARLSRRTGRPVDAGNAQLVLLFGMVGALFLTFMVIRVGHADDMRTRAQTAADAAALASLQPLRDTAVRFARERTYDPHGIGHWYDQGENGGHRRATRYADRNGAVLDGEPHITGILGHTVKVDVKTKDCQLIPEDQLTEEQKRDLKNPAKLCTDTTGNKGIGRAAHASAIAQLRLPACEYKFIQPAGPTSAIFELYCGGRFISSTDGRRASWNAVSQLFKVRLVAEEDPVPYTGRPAPRVSPGQPGTPAQVKQWIEEAITILLDHGVPAGLMNPDDIAIIIMHESGGNPTAINLWDSNARRGTPSKGLMQTIDPTFNAHKLPGYNNIYAPVDNIIAGVRYAIDRYGSVSQVPGVLGVKNGTGYVGY